MERMTSLLVIGVAALIFLTGGRANAEEKIYTDMKPPSDIIILKMYQQYCVEKECEIPISILGRREAPMSKGGDLFDVFPMVEYRNYPECKNVIANDVGMPITIFRLDNQIWMFQCIKTPVPRRVVVSE